MLRVISANKATRWVDAGRKMSQCEAYTQSGAMDWLSYSLANALCANELDAPAIEVVFGGFSCEIDESCTVAICGADASCQINGEYVPMHQALTLNAGSIISIDNVNSGVYTYLAIAADISLDTHFSSVCIVARESSVPANMQNVTLEKGASFALSNARSVNNRAENSILLPAVIENELSYQRALIDLPCCLAYQYALFDTVQIHRFFAEEYTVSTKFDSMGVRLEGVSITCSQKQLRSQGIANGAIQISGDGQPIIMRNERQTIGGYPIIGVVSKLALSRLSQVEAGQKVQFVETSVQQAHAEYLLVVKALERIKYNNQSQ